MAAGVSMKQPWLSRASWQNFGRGLGAAAPATVQFHLRLEIENDLLGLDGAAQVVHDLGNKADPGILARAASAYENSAVRRLGYLLEHFGHNRQASQLQKFVPQAKSFKDLDPASKPIVAALRSAEEKNQKWKLVINVPVEIDV